MGFQNTILNLFKPMQAIFPKEILPKYFIKFVLPKECLKTYFKYYYYKIYSLILKRLFSNHISICHYANKALGPNL
jgi:hypothetical protein